jgi:succinoglycan biosynthesis protein ExoO
MANYRGADHLEAAIRSVLGQTHQRVELIVSDDASDDDSCAIVRRIAAGDPRVRLIEAATNGGPSRARNAALAVAGGEWVAIVDADDLMQPDRLSRMLDAARHHSADAVADDQLAFGETAESGARPMFAALVGEGPAWIGAGDLLREETPAARAAPLGYLKPLIRRAMLDADPYDESLRNGEDFDLYLRLVLEGARLLLVPDATYLYRRHAASTSHRLTVEMLVPLIVAHDRLARHPAAKAPEIAGAMAARRRTLVRAQRYAGLVDALKDGRWIAAVALILRHPALILDLRDSFRERRGRQREAITPKT